MERLEQENQQGDGIKPRIGRSSKVITVQKDISPCIVKNASNRGPNLKILVLVFFFGIMSSFPFHVSLTTPIIEELILQGQKTPNGS